MGQNIVMDEQAAELSRTLGEIELFTRHGGNLEAARMHFPDAPGPWLDLSTGINAVPFPVPSFDERVWSRLPDAAALAQLESQALHNYGARPGLHAVAVAGSQAAIQVLPSLAPARRVAILGPTYSEHARTWTRAGAQVVLADRLDQMGDCDIAVVVNPNNPSGRLVPAGDLLAFARDLATHGGTLVVDEAFVDVLEPAASLVPAMPVHGVIALRSIGKAYGLAGLRLGFAICDAATAARLRDAMGPWPVSGPAVAVGRAIFGDAGWIATATARLRHDAGKLDDILMECGLDILGGTPLFRLARTSNAHAMFEALARAGILVRPFAEQADWLRFGVPHLQSDRDRLRAALRSLPGAK